VLHNLFFKAIFGQDYPNLGRLCNMLVGSGSCLILSFCGQSRPFFAIMYCNRIRWHSILQDPWMRFVHEFGWRILSTYFMRHGTVGCLCPVQI